MKELIQKLIREKINPVLELHDGSCELVKITDQNDVYLRLRGGCVGCPNSKLTLYNGVVPILMDNVSEIKDIYLED